jgi:Ca2+-binding EF-hand superfamily protein
VKKLLCAGVAVLGISATALCADDATPKDSGEPGALFAQLDGNKDGQLAADEIPAEKKGLFDRLVRIADKNGDGKLSSEEFAAGLAPQSPRPDRPDTAGDAPKRPEGRDAARFAERMFKRMDTNSDGSLTLSEVPEERKPMFQRLLKRAKKSENDGLTREEFVAALGDRPDRPDKAGRPNKPGRPERPGRPPEGFPPGGPRGGLFAVLDTDRDHKLSSAELQAAGEVLKKLDRDGDGSVTIEELMEFRPGGND